MRAPEPARKDGPRVNEEIRSREVHLIMQDGANRGTVSIAEALQAAQLIVCEPCAARPRETGRFAVDLGGVYPDLPLSDA